MSSNKNTKTQHISCTKVRIVPESRKEVDVKKLVGALIAVAEKTAKQQAA